MIYQIDDQILWHCSVIIYAIGLAVIGFAVNKIIEYLRQHLRWF